MIDLQHIAEAALRRDALTLRSLVQELLRSGTPLHTLAPPSSSDRETLTCAAALVDLLASRRGEEAPGWVKDAPRRSTPMFLVAAAETMPRLRKLCQEESPEPLMQRGFWAPPDFLTSL